MEPSLVIFLVLCNIGLCFLIALLGRNRRIGLWWSFFACFFLSPLVGLIITLCSKKKDVDEENDTTPINTAHPLGQKPTPPSRNEGDSPIPLSVDTSQDYGIKTQLLKLCSPENFMKPYEPEKVKVAKELYDEIKQTEDFDIRKLRGLRKEAESSLCGRISVGELYSHLIDVLSPKKYIDSSADVFYWYSDMYTKLTSCKNDIEGIENILLEVEIQKDLWKRQREEEEKKKADEAQEKADRKSYEIVGFCGVVFTILIILLLILLF